MNKYFKFQKRRKFAHKKNLYLINNVKDDSGLKGGR